MNFLRSFFEIFLSIHILLLVSSFFIGGTWLLAKPSFKLHLIRLLLISCIFSPIIIHFIKPVSKPLLTQFISVDALQISKKQPVIEQKKSVFITTQSLPNFKIMLHYFEISIFILLFLVILFFLYYLIRFLFLVLIFCLILL